MEKSVEVTFPHLHILGQLVNHSEVGDRYGKKKQLQQVIFSTS